MPAFLFKLETEDGAPDRAGREAAGRGEAQDVPLRFRVGPGSVPPGGRPPQVRPDPTRT